MYILQKDIHVFIWSLIAILYPQKFRMCIRKLNFVDNTLELLGTPKEYRRMRNSIKWLFIAWLIIICITWFIDSIWLIQKHNDIRAMFIPLIKNYTLHINILMDIMYMFLLRSVIFGFFNYLIIELLLKSTLKSNLIQIN